eukprot:PITA_22779
MQKDSNKHTGCFDLDCAGFVSTAGPTSPGVPLDPVSVYGGNQTSFLLTLKKTDVQKDIKDVWSLYLEGELIGYWPDSLFTNLGDGCKGVEIGGTVSYPWIPLGTALPKTDMGSGRFPSAGYGYAAYIDGIQLTTLSGAVMHTPPLVVSTNWKCYNATYSEEDNRLFYGGTGGKNPGCVSERP